VETGERRKKGKVCLLTQKTSNIVPNQKMILGIANAGGMQIHAAGVEVTQVENRRKGKKE